MHMSWVSVCMHMHTHTCAPVLQTTKHTHMLEYWNIRRHTYVCKHLCAAFVHVIHVCINAFVTMIIDILSHLTLPIKSLDAIILECRCEYK